jgi:glycerol-3-phosphate acyltransferase PlsX
MCIAVDAMGGDFAPAHVIRGGLDALQESGGRFSLAFVGREEVVRHELQGLARETSDPGFPRGSFSVVDAPEVIEMQDPPNAALKTKKRSSISIGLELQREGKAQAFVSAGNTGAVLSASTIILGRVHGVGRPTIGALVPTTGSPCLLVDAGTNVDCKPRHLFEFAVMGSIFMEAMLGTRNPSVGLLNVGEEESKGNAVTLEAFGLLKKSSLNFAGNVEGRDILAGKVDVVVCDGFPGNILLKFGESVPAFLKAKFTRFASQSLLKRLVVLVARGSMRAVLRELDYQEYGGVPLLGVNGVSIIGHGGSTPKAIKNMILRAEEAVLRNVNGRITEAMLKYT